MAKVKCRVCNNEVSGLCTIKKIGIKTNKPRICESFVYDETKVKIHKEIPTIKFGYKEKQEAKLMRKEASRRAKEAVENDWLSKQSPDQPINIKHPLTGDLSRFTSSAEKEGEE